MDKFEFEEFSYVMRLFANQRVNLDDWALRRALMFVKDKLHVSDEMLVGDMIGSKSKLPRWLASHKSVVGRVEQRFQPNQFPYRKWLPQRRPTFQVLKLRKTRRAPSEAKNKTNLRQKTKGKLKKRVECQGN